MLHNIKLFKAFKTKQSTECLVWPAKIGMNAI